VIWYRLVRWVGAALWTAVLCLSPAQAHLLPAQKGTLNFVGEAAFMVLSVPVSAFHGVDDDGDGALSAAELNAHGWSVQEQVRAGVELSGARGTVPLHILMLEIAPSVADRLTAPAKQITVMGRFESPPASRDSPTQTGLLSDSLTLRFSLFGTGPGEQAQDWTITHQEQTQWLRYVPGNNSHEVLPDGWAVWTQYLAAGAYHVLSGVDHMLFLLVVLSAARTPRALVGVITCFTLGHALTLLACVWGGVSLSSGIVEPAIAATIVGMAGFDLWLRGRGPPDRPNLRLVLVFLFALVHGLGLAGALTGLTQWSPGTLPWNMALSGFNVGIEMGQIAVAAAVAALVLALRVLRAHSSTSNR